MRAEDQTRNRCRLQGGQARSGIPATGSLGDSNQNYTDIDFALMLQGSTLRVYEGGVWRADVSSYVASDRLRVAVEAGQVKYYKNDTLLYTSTASSVTYPLPLDTLLSDVSSQITSAMMYGQGLR